MNPSNRVERAAEAACRQLVSARETLLLSTVNTERQPEISYAPYIRDRVGDFVIFVSELATHTGNLLRQGEAAVMFIESEAASRNPFSRQRVILQCRATEVAREEGRYPVLLAGLEERFGETVALLRSLPDFHLITLTPRSGRYVAGFGKAYDIELPDWTLLPLGPS
ncbi:MAG: pyridoxamine 5'-phosphate oxidase family protein [Sedimenticola sp.]|nr:pyridoxamine 5'-phosphate oxidase family protein [Sedimenticola sp.]